MAALLWTVCGAGIASEDATTDGAADRPVTRAPRKSHGFLPAQNDWVNHTLNMGVDIPPNELVPASKIPHTQNDFLLILKKSKEAIAKNPKDAGAYLDLGYASRNLNNYFADLEACNKSIELDPNIAVAYAERGMANEGLRDFETAVADLKKAIELDPNNSAFYSHLGRIALRKRDFQSAINECTRSINRYAGYSPAFYYRGKAHLALDQFTEAIEDFSAAIKLYPNEMVGYYVDRAYAQVQLDEFQKALADLRIAVKVDPEDFPRQVDMTFRAGQSDNTAEARQRILDFAKALGETKEYSELLQQALFHRVMRNYVKAIDIFDQAIKQFPLVAELYQMRGSTYFDMNLDEKAMLDFSRTLEIDPANADAYHHRALLYLKKKDFPAAINDLTQLIKIRPDRTGYILRSGAYRALGETDKANADLASFKDVAMHSYQAKNLPAPENFERFLKRDIDLFFSKQLNKAVNVEYEQIKVPLPPIAALGLPKSYYWVRIFANDRMIDQGAVVAGAIHQERFMFQDFVNIATVRKNPKNAISIFPPPVGAEILKFAGVKPPATTKTK